MYDVIDAPARDVFLSVCFGGITQLLGNEAGVDFGRVSLVLLTHDEEDHLRSDELQGFLTSSTSQKLGVSTFP